MIVGIFYIHLRIPLANSLKEKRGYLKGTIERLKKKYNISIAEVDNHDHWHSTVLGLSCVSNDKSVVENTIRKILDDLEMINGIELEAYEEEYY